MDFMGLKLDDNIIWILVILAIVFFLFPINQHKNDSEKVSEEVEEKEECDCIYRRKRDGKERRRLEY
jgi:uncharacterized membrane protein